MDVHTIYSEWREYARLPNMNAVVDFTIAGKTRELEFVTKLYRTVGETLDLTPAFENAQLVPLLLQKIPSTWNDNIAAVITVSADILANHADLRVFLRVTEDDLVTTPPPMVERRPSTSSVDALTEQMVRLTLVKSADDYVASRSKRNIGTMSEMTGARVPVEWVRQCASTVIADGDTEGEDTSEFLLLRDQSDRHIHYINASVPAFLQRLTDKFEDDNGLARTITWQFSRGSMFAIHLQQFKQAATILCPGNPFEFIVFACAVGIPIHELMKTRDIIATWKSGRFKLLNQDNIMKVLLRRRFPTPTSDVEANQLLRRYRENIADFQVQTPTDDIDLYFFRRFYAYPTVDELEHLEQRIRKNTHTWFDLN